jgi:hypothetical protein
MMNAMDRFQPLNAGADRLLLTWSGGAAFTCDLTLAQAGTDTRGRGPRVASVPQSRLRFPPLTFCFVLMKSRFLRSLAHTSRGLRVRSIRVEIPATNRASGDFLTCHVLHNPTPLLSTLASKEILVPTPALCLYPKQPCSSCEAFGARHHSGKLQRNLTLSGDTVNRKVTLPFSPHPEVTVALFLRTNLQERGAGNGIGVDSFSRRGEKPPVRC